MKHRGALAIVALLELILASSVAGYRWFSIANPVSRDEAVRQFLLVADPITPPAPTPIAARTPEPLGKVGPPLVPLSAKGPPPGVYRWRTRGSETYGAFTRELPAPSFREIASGRVTHIYSDHHSSRWEPMYSDSGVEITRLFSDVAFGPVGSDRRIAFDPPVRYVVTPLEVGQRWQGDWIGAVSGHYEGLTFEHSSLRIASVDVEVWGIELRVTLTGGSVVHRFWITPDLMVVKEKWNVKLPSRFATYTAKWESRIESLGPAIID